MSVIHKLSVLGIRSFGVNDEDKQVIEFLNPLTLILGANGTGKTTIIECLRYITTGDMPPGSRAGGGGAFIHDPKIAQAHKVNAQVRLQFRDVIGKTCVVQRSLEATQKAKRIEMRTLDGVLSRAGADGQRQSITSRCAELDHEMISSLGVSKPILDNVIFCHQEESNWPLSEGKALKEKFDAIFASTRYVKALECIKKLKQSQDQMMKEYKAELKYLKQNKETASKMAGDLTEAETKLEASKSSVENVKSEIVPLEDKLEKILSKSADINRLNARIGKMTGEREVLLKTISELEENITNKFIGTDGELKRCVDQFHEKIREQEESLKQYENEKRRLQRKLDGLNNERSVIDRDVGKQEQEAEDLIENRRRRDSMLRQIAANQDTEGFDDGDITSEHVDSFKHQIDRVLIQLDKRVKDIKREYEEKESEVECESYRLRDKKTRLEQDVHNRQERLKKNRSELKDIGQKLTRSSTSRDRLVRLEKEIQHVEKELGKEQNSINVSQTRAEIEDLQTEKRSLDVKLTSLNSEINRLNLHSGIRTELKLLEKQKSEKEDAVKRIKARHENTLMHLLEVVPADNIRGALDDCLIKLSDEVKMKERDVQTQQMDLSRQEANRKMLKEQLKKREAEVRNLEEKIYDACGSQNYDEGLQMLKQKMNCAQDQRGSLLGAEHFFRKYVNELKAEDPCCPLCHREFDAQLEVRELIVELESKLKLVPRRLEQSEKDLNEYKTRYDALLQIKPLRDTINTLETGDIPELKKKILDTSTKIDSLQSSIEEKRDELRIQKSDESLAASVTPDVVLMDRSLCEIRDLDRKIKAQLDKLPGSVSDRTMDQTNEEKMETHLSLEAVMQQLEHKRERLRNHGDAVQSLKDQINELRSERLQVEREEQQRSKLSERRDTLTVENSTLEREAQDMKEELSPVQTEIQKVKSLKSRILTEKEKLLDDAKGKVDALNKNLSDFNSLHSAIIGYITEGKAEKLAVSKRRQAQIQRDLDSITMDVKELSESCDKVREELSNQQVREREMEDNQKLREKIANVADLDGKISHLRDDIGGLDPVGLEKKKMELLKKKDELQKQCLTAEGRQKGYVDEIYRLKADLKLDQYSGAEDKYREKMITLKTTEIANRDLGKYYTVLDRAIMDYHSLKMTEINKIIRDLWKKTYRGNDIEMIEIRSDDDAGGSVKLRRLYHYRVVMIRGDIEMDMRGRCSAGQKVLASLIIRLALAETFCLNCGILALDEPTTNLDRENIESLAYALVEIIKSRAHQVNFRLIVITHDEDFVELLGRSEFVEEFFKIRKNSRGCSQIVRSAITDIHT